MRRARREGYMRGTVEAELFKRAIGNAVFGDRRPSSG
jgi:hypothetical protein